MTQHDPRCIDHQTCDGMIEARDRCIHQLAAEMDQLRKEAARLRGALRQIAELEGDTEHQVFKLTRFQAAQVARAALALATPTPEAP